MFEEDRAQGAESEEDKAAAREWQAFDRDTLATLRELGADLVPIGLPDSHPVEALSFILTAEASAAFACRCKGCEQPGTRARSMQRARFLSRSPARSTQQQ